MTLSLNVSDLRNKSLRLSIGVVNQLVIEYSREIGPGTHIYIKPRLTLNPKLRFPIGARPSLDIGLKSTIFGFARAKISYFISGILSKVKATAEIPIRKIAKLVFACELATGEIVFWAGFKKNKTRFLLPFAVVQLGSVAEAIGLLVLYGAVVSGFCTVVRRRKHKETKKANNRKAEEDRRKEVSLLTRRADECLARERAKEAGLFIIFGAYGAAGEIRALAEAADPQEAFNRESLASIDVTIPLRYYVRNSSLHLHPTHKSDLLGFGIPAAVHSESDCELLVRYSIRGVISTRAFRGDIPVSIP
eukprot:TRINITY_DN12711_c0_g1_i3.p1 TRINITY_DN12711_c0_g1~~TRINITY_DN12711_c0_g1_i3.p1  ORF type:complete len:305 (-),score=47.74 TRINITY_DN12711_c0_g1_i3:117-1031(-)